MMALAFGIAIIGVMIGYIIGHQLGYKQAVRVSHGLLEAMILKCMEYVPSDERPNAIHSVRRVIRDH